VVNGVFNMENQDNCVVQRNGEKPSWYIRRKIIILTLIFSAIIIAYLTVYGEDNRLHETIATGLIFLSASVIGSYVFGAVWNDKK
jgi:Na+/proline symporter